MGETQTKILRIHRPQNALDAKICGEFAVTAALIAGNCGRAELTDAFVQRTDVQASCRRSKFSRCRRKIPMSRRIRRSTGCGSPCARGGEVTSEPVFKPRGHFTRPVDGERLWQKFADCAGDVLGPSETQALFDSLQSLPRLASAGRARAVAGLAVGGELTMSSRYRGLRHLEVKPQFKGH